MYLCKNIFVAPRKRSSRIEAKLPEILPSIQVESESEKRLQKEKKREVLRQKVMDHMRDSAFTCVSKEEIDKEVERIEKQQLIEERLRLRKEKEEEQRLAEEAAAIAEQKEKVFDCSECHAFLLYLWYDSHLSLHS